MHLTMGYMYSGGPLLSVGVALRDSNILRSNNLRIVGLDSSGNFGLPFALARTFGEDCYYSGVTANHQCKGQKAFYQVIIWHIVAIWIL